MLRTPPAAITFAAFLALAACGRSENSGKAPSPTPNAPPHAEATRMAKVAAKCAPAPTLALAQDFADPGGKFASGSKPFKQLEANFAQAYGKSCSDGVFTKQPLIPADFPHPDKLFLTNAPEANDVAIYRLTDDNDKPGDMTLEFYFVTEDGEFHVPSADDLTEAIYCATQGATEEEQDTTGRCLVD